MGALSTRLCPQLEGAWTPLLRGFIQQQQQPAPFLQSLARLPLPVPAPVSTSPPLDRSAPVLHEEDFGRTLRSLLEHDKGADSPLDTDGPWEQVRRGRGSWQSRADPLVAL
jgi:hypothetical protein